MERKELLQTPEYWTGKAQFDLYAHAEDFMRERNMNRKQLADFLGVSKGYVSQLLNGEYDHKLSKYISLAMMFGYVPVVRFIPIAEVLEMDKHDYIVSEWRKFHYKDATPQESVNVHNYRMGEFTSDFLIKAA